MTSNKGEDKQSDSSANFKIDFSTVNQNQAMITQEKTQEKAQDQKLDKDVMIDIVDHNANK